MEVGIGISISIPVSPSSIGNATGEETAVTYGGMRVKRKMYSVNGIRAMKIRVVSDNEDALVEAEVEEDDSGISCFCIRSLWDTHLVNGR
jgi:hypothetical protein